MKIVSNTIFSIKKTLQKSTKTSLFLILTPYLALALIGSFLIYERLSPKTLENENNVTPNQTITEGSSENKETILTIGNKNSNKIEVNYWEIIDVSKNPRLHTGIKILDKEPSKPIVRWENFLLAINQENYLEKKTGAYLGSNVLENYILNSQVRTIRVFNLDNGDTFDIPLERPVFGEVWYLTSQVIDNTYYFGLGGAFGASLSYKLDLPPKRNSEIIKLSSPIGGKITKYGNIYISSTCYEGCSYSLFNPTSLTLKPLKRMSDANNGYLSGRKEELIGVDSYGRMIINVRRIPESNINQKVYETEFILTVPLSDEKSEKILLEVGDFPEKILKYFMIDGIDKILMQGVSKNYIYNIKTGTFKELITDTSFHNQFLSGTLSISKKNKFLCFSDTDTVKFSIDLNEENYSNKPASECLNQQSDESIEGILKNLGLPDNFEFRYTTVSYGIYSETK